MANAGTYGANIGKGALMGAGAGMFLGPWGAAVGGVVGGGLGALETLLTSSDEAKKRKQAMDAYEEQRAQALHQYTEQQRNKYYDEWEQRNAARVSAFTGTNLAQDPMYAATHHESFDPEQAAADFSAKAGSGPTFPDDPPPDYAGLAQAAMQFGGTAGSVARQSAAQERLDALIQSRKNAAAQANGSAWGGYANPDDPWGMY